MTERTTLEIIAPTVEEALAQGLAQLGLPADAVSVEVLDSGNKGLFGLGGRQVRVRLTVHGPGDEPTLPAASGGESARRDQASATRASAPKLGSRPRKGPRPVEESKAADTHVGNVRGAREAREARPAREPREPREVPKPSASAGLELGELPIDGHDAVLDQAEATISRLLYFMGLQAQVSAHYGEAREDRRPIMVDIRGSDLGILIGRRGETLAAFQYLSALMVGKETGQFVRLVVDVEGHRDRRERQLRQLAQHMAEQVLKTGRKLTLEPMPASERRIIHLELREHPAVTTQSTGEEPHRKITILPKE
jgi:spoIIIJ-associated protein